MVNAGWREVYVASVVADTARRQPRRRRARNEANHVRLHIAAACARHLCNLAVEVGVPVDAGHSPLGQRRLVPILGGTVGGRLSGRVLPGGATSR
jgi:hypothetical protein